MTVDFSLSLEMLSENHSALRKDLAQGLPWAMC